MAVDVGSAVGYLDLDISGFLSNLRTAQSEADNASKNIATKIGKNITGIGESFTSAGSSLTKGLTVPLAGVGVAGLKVATNFEKGMSEVKAISKATGDEFNALREKAIELGADTAFSANEVAAAMTEMAKAGWDSQQIIDGMGGVLDAAAASGEGLATVSTIVADAITGFGLEAKESTKIADLLTQAANSGTIGIVDLGESFKYIAPVAGSMGISVEDVTTALSAMSMAGIKGSAAGTSLRTMLTNLVKPTDAVAVAMENLGIEVVNQDGSMKSLDEIISNLRTSFDGLTEAEKAKYAATLAGKEGMSGMLSLLNLTQEEYDAIAASMNNANGVAKETAEVMQDNLQSKFEQLGGSLESLAIKLADYVIPSLQEFVEWLTGLIDKLTSLDPETQKSILKFAAMAAVIGPVLLVVGKLVTTVGGLITAFGKIPGAITAVKTGFTTIVASVKHVGEAYTLAKAGMTGFASQTSVVGTALAGITAPIAAVIAIVGALVAAVVTLWNTNEEFRNNIITIWNEIKETVGNFINGIVERLNALGIDFKSITEVLWSIWKGFCDLLAPIFEGTFKTISILLETILGVITGLLDVFIGFFTGNWEQLWNGVKGIFSSVGKGLVDIAVNAFNTIINVFKNLPDKVLEIGRNIVEGLWNGIQNAKTWLTNKVTGFANSVLNGFKSAFGIHSPSTEMEEQGGYMMEGLGLGMEDGLSGILNFISSMFESVMDRIGSLVDSISGIFSGSMFDDTDTKVLDKYNMTLLNTLNIYRQLSEQMKLCTQYSQSFSVDGSGLVSLGSGTPDIMSMLSKLINNDVDFPSSIKGKGNGTTQNQNAFGGEQNTEGKPDTLVIPITIGDEQIENVVVDLLRREVRT